MPRNSSTPKLKAYIAQGDIVFGNSEAGEVTVGETVQQGQTVRLNPDDTVVSALITAGKLKPSEDAPEGGSGGGGASTPASGS